jgi:hypothetical protein
MHRGTIRLRLLLTFLHYTVTSTAEAFDGFSDAIVIYRSSVVIFEQFECLNLSRSFRRCSLTVRDRASYCGVGDICLTLGLRFDSRSVGGTSS